MQSDLSHQDAPSSGNTVAAQVADARRRFRNLMQARLDANLLPHEGHWLSREELEARVQADKRRSRVHAIELTLLLLAGVVLSLLILQILRNIVY